MFVDIFYVYARYLHIYIVLLAQIKDWLPPPLPQLKIKAVFC